MELVKKKIHMDRIASKAGTQMVLEEDVNISDNRPDAAHLIASKGDVVLDEVRVNDDRVSLKGKLQVQILYLTEDEGMCACMTASVPFDEKINMLNKQLESFSRINSVRLVDAEFEKTPERSIKRFLYQPNQ